MTLVERAKAIWSLFTEGKLTKIDKLILVASVLYCLSPVDIIPDVMPVVGILDDILVFLASVRHFSRRAAAEQAPRDGDENLVQVDAKVIS